MRRLHLGFRVLLRAPAESADGRGLRRGRMSAGALQRKAGHIPRYWREIVQVWFKKVGPRCSHLMSFAPFLLKR